MPSFLQGRFLRCCLRSLAAQTYPHLEVVVRDKLSDDQTPQILNEFRGTVTVVRERDAGQTDALCRGLREAQGSILGWLNADDMLMPDAVERVVTALELQPSADVVYGHCALLDEGGQFLRYFDDIRPFSADELRNYTDFIPQASTFFRRQSYERVGGLDQQLNYAMDWDLWCRFARHGMRFTFLPKVVSGVRLHPSTKTATGGLARFYEVARVNARHRTHTLPMVPVLYAAHLFSTRARRLIGPAYGPLRQAWRRITGRSGETGKAVVGGLTTDGRIADRAFSIELPVYRALAGARLFVSGPGEVQARLGGVPGTPAALEEGGITVGWTLPVNTVCSHVRICGEAEGPSATRSVRLRLGFADL